MQCQATAESGCVASKQQLSCLLQAPSCPVVLPAAAHAASKHEPAQAGARRRLLAASVAAAVARPAADWLAACLAASHIVTAALADRCGLQQRPRQRAGRPQREHAARLRPPPLLPWHRVRLHTPQVLPRPVAGPPPVPCHDPATAAQGLALTPSRLQQCPGSGWQRLQGSAPAARRAGPASSRLRLLCRPRPHLTTATGASCRPKRQGQAGSVALEQPGQCQAGPQIAAVWVLLWCCCALVRALRSIRLRRRSAGSAARPGRRRRHRLRRVVRPGVPRPAACKRERAQKLEKRSGTTRAI